MKPDFSQVIDIVREYDDSLDVSDLSIYNSEGEQIIELEYLSDKKDCLLRFIGYQELPLAYYNEIGEVYPVAALPSVIQDEIIKKIRNTYRVPYDYDFDVPEWALNFIEYGADETLTDEEINIVKAWLEEKFPHGFTMEVDWDDYNECDPCPAFGNKNPHALPQYGEPPYLACKTYRCYFYNTKNL